MNKSQNLVKTDYWNIKRSQSRQEKTQCTSNSNIYWEHNTDVVAFACLQLKCHLLRCEVDCIFFFTWLVLKVKGKIVIGKKRQQEHGENTLKSKSI